MKSPLLIFLVVTTSLAGDGRLKPDKFKAGIVSGTEILQPCQPMPMFVGPGPPYPNPAIPNLEPKSSKEHDRLEMPVPAGVRLVSGGCPVTSSDPAPMGDLSLITDGERFGDDGYFSELAPGKQWVQLDLKESKRLHLIWVWRFHKMPVSFRDLLIQVSDDPGFKTSETVHNTDHDNSLGLGNGKDASYYESSRGRAVPFPPVTGRYVRLWSNGADTIDSNCYIEVSVYGEAIRASPK